MTPRPSRPPLPSRRRRRLAPPLAVGLSVTVLAGSCSGGTTASTGHPARSPSTVASGGPATTTAATGPDAAHPCGTTATPPARYQHVVWIWMENHDWPSVLSGNAAPYLDGLAARCATDRAWATVGSPSLPNYLGATAGTTFGVGDDADPAAHSFSADNLFRQVRTAGGTEASYVESMPSACDLVSAGDYAAKHNPAVYYDGPGDRAACRADDLPLTALPPALAAGRLPTYTSITPNLCDDMHNCSVATGDAWLSTWVPRLVDSAPYRSGTTVIVIVFDESTPAGNVVVAPSIRPGTVSDAAVDHYSLLRATEETLGLPLLGRAAGAPSLRRALGF